MPRRKKRRRREEKPKLKAKKAGERGIKKRIERAERRGEAKANAGLARQVESLAARLASQDEKIRELEGRGHEEEGKAREEEEETKVDAGEEPKSENYEDIMEWFEDHEKWADARASQSARPDPATSNRSSARKRDTRGAKSEEREPKRETKLRSEYEILASDLEEGILEFGKEGLLDDVRLAASPARREIFFTEPMLEVLVEEMDENPEVVIKAIEAMMESASVRSKNRKIALRTAPGNQEKATRDFLSTFRDGAEEGEEEEEEKPKKKGAAKKPEIQPSKPIRSTKSDPSKKPFYLLGDEEYFKARTDFDNQNFRR